MTIVTNIVAAIVNFWDGLPEWLRKGLRDAAIGAVAAVVALNLAIPGTLDQAKAEGLTAYVAAGAAALAIVRVELLPYLLSWLLSQLGLYYTAQVGKDKGPKLVRYN
jgi:hypothetical protein